MSLFDSASLVVTPNGYKEDKLYSIKPTDGSGDLVATTATRVNSAGLVELVPYNLLSYSEQFDNAIWSKYQTSITANTTIAPNGTLTADTITDNTATDVHIVNQGVNVGAGTYTISVYAKANTLSNINLQWYDGVSAFSQSNVFNLSTGITTGANQSIENVGNGWYRCSYTITTTQTGTQYPYVVLNNGSSAYYTGTGQSLYIWGAQLVTGTSAKEYFPTTDRLNVPRLDYTNSSCPSILVEPQRTNINKYSEDFTNGIYYNQNTTIIANSTTAPDGTSTADKLVITGSGVTSIFSEVATTSGNYYTTSVYVKKAETQYVNLGFIYSAGIYAGTQFDLNNGTIKRNSSLTYTNLSSTITNVGNGWYRLTVTCLINVGFEAYPTILPSNAEWTSGEPRQNLTGNNTTGAYFWGLQMELGSYATSYIPTVASSVTRNADVISKTGISSLIGQTEGVLFFDFVYNELDTNGLIPITLANDSINNVYCFIESNNRINFNFVIVGADVLNIQTATGFAVKGTRYKIALAYKANDFAVYINGVLIGTQNTGAVIGFNDFYFGYPFASGYNYPLKINSAQLYKTRLTNTELASLTTI